MIKNSSILIQPNDAGVLGNTLTLHLGSYLTAFNRDEDSMMQQRIFMENITIGDGIESCLKEFKAIDRTSDDLSEMLKPAHAIIEMLQISTGAADSHDVCATIVVCAKDADGLDKVREFVKDINNTGGQSQKGGTIKFGTFNEGQELKILAGDTGWAKAIDATGFAFKVDTSRKNHSSVTMEHIEEASQVADEKWIRLMISDFTIDLANCDDKDGITCIGAGKSKKYIFPILNISAS